MTSNLPSSRGLSPEYVLLGFLCLKPMHGYELHQQMKQHLGEIWHISQSQVYNILKRLEGNDFISAVREDQEKLPDRIIFHIMEGGRDHFADWLNQPTRCNVKAIRVEFLTRLFFSWRLMNGTIQQMIDEQQEHTEEEFQQLSERFEGLPQNQVFNRLGLSLRLKQIESTLLWLDEVDKNMVGEESKE